MMFTAMIFCMVTRVTKLSILMMKMPIQLPMMIQDFMAKIIPRLKAKARFKLLTEIQCHLLVAIIRNLLSNLKDLVELSLLENIMELV